MSDSLVQRFAKRPEHANDSETPDEFEATDDLGTFGWLRGVRDRALMLELRKKDGNIRAVSYSWIEEIEFNPSEGITLCFAGRKIMIRGRNLNCKTAHTVRLFQGLARHRVPWIQEADEPKLLQASKSATIVEEIEW